MTDIIVDVELVTGAVIVQCIFDNIPIKKCYIQLVSDVLGGYHEGGCLEVEGVASHSFTDLVPGMYTLLVYGLDRKDELCLPSGHQDYITVFSITTSQTIPVTSDPSMYQKSICNP